MSKMKNDINIYSRKIKKDIRINDNHILINFWLSISVMSFSLVWMVLYFFWLKYVPSCEFSYRLGEFLKNIIPAAFLTASFYFILNYLPLKNEERRNARLIANVQQLGSYSINKIKDITLEFLILYLMPEAFSFNSTIRHKRLFDIKLSISDISKRLNNLDGCRENIVSRNKAGKQLQEDIQYFTEHFDGSHALPIINILCEIKMHIPIINPTTKKSDFILLTGDIYYILLLYKLLDKRVKCINNYLRRLPDFRSLIE